MNPIAAIFLVIIGALMILSAAGLANSSRPGTRKRWLRAMIAAALAGMGLMLVLKPATAMAGEIRPLPSAMLVLYPTLTDDRPYPVSHFKSIEDCQGEANRMNKNPEQSLNQRARAVGAIAVCFAPLPVEGV